MPTDINLVPNVFVKPDFMIMELITYVLNVVIFVTNVSTLPIIVPSVQNQEILYHTAHAHMECLIIMENVFIVITNVKAVLILKTTVILVLETE
jgi:hypothetical protein